MKTFLQSIIDKLNTYLSGLNGVESAMRLYAFMIVTTGCICMFVFTGYVCNNLLKVNLNDAAVFVLALATFIGTGLGGKWLQSKIENKTAIVNAVTTKMEDAKTNDSSTADNITATGNM